MDLPSLMTEPWMLLLGAVLVWYFYALKQKERDENGPEPKPTFRGSTPDMALSAGRDAAQQNARFQQIFVPMQPEEEPAFRRFYLQIIGLTEMRAPNYPKDVGGFWAVSGARQIYFGARPYFPADPNAMPSFPVTDLKTVGAALDGAGYDLTWDQKGPYALRAFITDPGGTAICLIAA